ncbi:qor [Cucurbita argyrosperma subsp. argyrosperma]|nr:qor [Cucurbita argyrosperma subsp. argyrosperma]
MFLPRITSQFHCDLRLLLPSSRLFHCSPIVSRHFFKRIPSSLSCSSETPRCDLKLGAENFIARAVSSRVESSAPEMVKAIRVHEVGGPEVLKWEDVDIGEPKEGEVRVRNKAIGLNFIDVYFRKGDYKAATMPFTPGMEAAGVVTAVGPGVNDRKVGDLVAYAGNPMGSYSEEQILPADKVVPVPPSVDPTIAASVMLKGMTAQFLLRRCYKVEPGNIVLVHAAAGGVGSLLCQWANSLGATVIGTISTKEKAIQAKEDGCHHVIISKEEDFVARVNEITSGNGVNVVYDSVGKDTFQGSLACLKTRGYMVSFGQSSGPADPVPLSALAAKSLFLTRPSLMQYTATRDELLEAAQEVFANIESGTLRVRVNHTYPLFEAARAHADLESRKTTGSVVLIP